MKGLARTKRFFEILFYSCAAAKCIARDTAKRLASQMMRFWLTLTLALALVLAPSCGKKKRKTRVPAAPAAAAVIGDEEEGIASWYGHPYHGRAAANGEIYDMEKLTAAHRTLPFSTWVKVENLTNGKKVTVRITDRGPFIDGRIIDLSHAAAREIELIGPGTAPVRLTVVEAPRTAGVEHFAVQIGAFGERERAERLRERMAVAYGRAQLIPRPGSPTLWRVLVGDEPSEPAARELAGRLRGQGQAGFVVRLDAPVAAR
jgi:rare lipoprotein A